jgi:hypothetical protein
MSAYSARRIISHKQGDERVQCGKGNIIPRRVGESSILHRVNEIATTSGINRRA